MWGNVAVTQAYLTLSEVLGHIDLLIGEGRVQERDEDGIGAVCCGLSSIRTIHG